MRHLNEIVRERNQYSRDALEAWQDFINLKGRMDTELTKVTKRNNFLVEELETWKQQFLKFQKFAEQLTKETSELKVKIETHKRESRRLTSLIDQQKDDIIRLTLRLSGTEKQRDDALEALVLQQEIAEELERERKRNEKEIASLQHTNSNLLRQRDDAQRVVIHLRSLINGQAHHMEHIVRSIDSSPELSQYIEDGHDMSAEDTAKGDEEPSKPQDSASKATSSRKSSSRLSNRSATPAQSDDTPTNADNRILSVDKRRRSIRLSMSDVADRHLRDKTDAIADIIRTISDQCAAAVEGLQLAQADFDNSELSKHNTGQGGMDSDRTNGSEADDNERTSLSPDGRQSTIPPTPDLVPNRSSTSMSMASSSTFQERSSQQYGPNEIPTKIVEHDDEHAHETTQEEENVSTMGKPPSDHNYIRPGTSAIIA